MKNQIRYIALFLFTILMVFQMMHVGHSVEQYSAFFTEPSEKNLALLSQNSKRSSRKDLDVFSNRNDQHKFCLICHSNAGHYLIWDIAFSDSFTFEAFIDWPVISIDRRCLCDRYDQFAVISLRGPPLLQTFI